MHLSFMKHTKKDNKRYNENYYIKLNTVKETLVENLNKILNFFQLPWKDNLLDKIGLHKGKGLSLMSNKC